MSAWGDDDPPPEPGPAGRRRGLHGYHLLLGGLLLVPVGVAASALGGAALGPMIVVLGVTLAVLGALGWMFEGMGAYDDEPGTDPNAIGLNDVAKLATRIRRR